MQDLKSIITVHKGKTNLPIKSSYIQEWAQWYKGNVKNFHYYRLYNGQQFLNIDIKSMQMAKYISETWADLLLNEKCKIVVPEKPQKELNKILRKTNFWYKANNGLEKSFALGLGALVAGVKNLEIGDKGTVKKDKAFVTVDFVDAFKIVPITVENGEIIECAFEYDSNDFKIFILHLIENGKYVIHNYKVSKHNQGMEYYSFNTQSEIPMFQIIKPNIANNLNDELSNVEQGISVYANAIDGLKDLDMKYDSYYNEGILKRTKVYVSGKAYKVDTSTGEKIKTWNPMDAQYYFTGKTKDGENKVDVQSPTLQYQEQIAGINAQLNYVGMRCGFGQNFFRFDGTSIMTATQVISENNAMARRITKHEILLEHVLIGITKAVQHLANNFTNNPIGEFNEEDITIKFDDSVIEDKEAEMKRDKEDVSAGLMSRVEYRVKWYGEDKDTAIANVKDYFLNEIIDDYLPALTQGGMTPTQFVDKVYGDIENKEEVIAYITNQIQAGSLDDFNSNLTFGKE